MASTIRSKAKALPPKIVPKSDDDTYGFKQLEVDSMLKTMIRAGEDVSDLFFMAGQPPHIKIHGALQPMPTEPPDSGLTPEHIEGMFTTMTAHNERLISEYQKTGSCDFTYSIRSSHFRVNYFQRNGLPAMVLKRLKPDIPSIAGLGLPGLLRQVTQEKKGLVLLTGALGHGKSTTLAALLNEINETSAIHAVTLEDPIQFIHPVKRAIISQRELGKDFFDFSAGLQVALRQSPHVIAVGDIRDRATMEMALVAAEMGKLVIGSFTTMNAAQTLSRITAMFEREEVSGLRQRLAESLRWILSQRLIAKVGGGRHLIMEILGNSARTREAILEGEKEHYRFTDIILSSQALGWQTFDQQIVSAFERGLISEETSLIYGTQKPRINKDVETTRRDPHFSHQTNSSSGLRLNADSVRVTRVIR